MSRVTTRQIDADTICPPLIDSDAPTSSRLEVPEALLFELAHLPCPEVAAALEGVCHALRWLSRSVRASGSTPPEDFIHDDGPVARAMAAALDWARDILLDADLLVGGSAMEQAGREELARYADLHVMAFVRPALADAHRFVRGTGMRDPRAYELLDAIDQLEMAILRAGVHLHGAQAVASAA